MSEATVEVVEEHLIATPELQIIDGVLHQVFLVSDGEGGVHPELRPVPSIVTKPAEEPAHSEE